MANAKTPPPQDGVYSDFPRSPSAFDADDRISFSRLDNKFILETGEGTEYEWDAALRRWVSVVRMRQLCEHARPVAEEIILT